MYVNVGFKPEEITIGDYTVVITSFSQLLALRKALKGTNEYSILDGMMYGQLGMEGDLKDQPYICKNGKYMQLIKTKKFETKEEK